MTAINDQTNPDKRDAKPEKPRPHKHLSVDELRAHEHITDEEWFEELEARGILSKGGGPWRPPENVEYIPGVLERFLRERA